MVKAIYMTDKVHEDLKRVSDREGISMEGLACVILRLALSDESYVKKLINFMKSCDMDGPVDLKRKGW